MAEAGTAADEELARLRVEHAKLQQRAELAEQAFSALVRGEIDAVSSGTTPILLHAAQAQLRSREQLFRTVFNSAHDGMMLTDDAGTYVDVNPAACEIFGRTREAFVGQVVAGFDAGWCRTIDAWHAFVRAGSVHGEAPFVRADGTARELAFSATANILPGLHLAVVQDVTERKRAEQSLHASEERYRRIVEATSEGVWMYDAQGVTTFVNARMAQLLGGSVAAVVGQPIYEFMFDADRESAHARVEQRKRGAVGRGAFRLRRTDGTELWVSIHADPLFDRDGRFEVTLALVEDASERRQADELRAWLGAIVDSAEYSIVGISHDGVVMTWNRGSERLFGYTSEEMIGKPYERLVPVEARAEYATRLKRFVRDEQPESYETSKVRKDGSRVEVSVVLSPVRDASGLIGASAIGHDLTERRQTEAHVRRVEEQLRQAQKLEAIGSLAGGVAHDFNNLLSVILTYAEFVRRSVSHDEALLGDVAEIAKAGQRATELTRQLLAFSRKQVLQPRVLELNQTVLALDRMLKRVLREDVVLQLRLKPDLGRVLVDPSQLEQVVMNLVVNARDSMPTGGTISVETRDVELDELTAERIGVSRGSYVMLIVTDTGTGMDAATRARIFEPFFTTKESGRGTGLGLSTVIGIVRQSGGNITVYSEPGHGSAFKVYLPRTDRVAEPPRSERPPPTTLVGTETVLLVEDDEQVRGVASAILRRNGYVVLEAQNPGEALLIEEQHAAPIHLLLTDVVMPRMSGPQLAERLTSRREAMKVLFVSGYTADAIGRHGVLEPNIEFLEKPFAPDSLLAKVRDVLDSARAASVTHP